MPTSAESSHQLFDASRVPIEAISPNPSQPREDFDDQKLEELAQSIRANGIIQPITVVAGESGRYTIIAGERRWRAAQLVGLKEIPVYVRPAKPDQILELALIENVQREDLNPVETAAAFRRLSDEYKLSHEQIAERTGKDRSTITNFLRLLRLTKPVLADLAAGRISVGHARVLLNLIDAKQQNDICQRIVEEQLSVRQTEILVKQLTEIGERKAPPVAKKEQRLDPNVRAALDHLTRYLGTKVRLVERSPKAGKLEIEYYSPDDLDRIYGLILQEQPRKTGAGGRS